MARDGNPGGRPPKYDDNVKKLIAFKSSTGVSYAQLAKEYNLAKSTVRAYCDEYRDELKAETAGALEEIKAQRANMLSLVPQSIDNLRSVVNQPGHTKNIEVSKFVIQQSLAVKAEEDGARSDPIASSPAAQRVLREALESVADGLRNMRLRRDPGEDEKHMRRGRAALPGVVVDAEVVD